MMNEREGRINYGQKEIGEGDVVPILQHQQCLGTVGTVVAIIDNSPRIKCNSCHRDGVILDGDLLLSDSSYPR